MEQEQMNVAQLTAHLQKGINELKASSDQSYATLDAVKGLESQMESLKGLDQTENVNKLFEKMNSLEGLMNKQTEGKEDFYSALEGTIKEKASEIQKLMKQGHGVIEIKAAELITTANATNPDGVPELVGVQLAPPSDVKLVDVFVDQFVSYENTSMAVLPYTETIPKDGDFEFVGEGEVKSQLDFKIETRYAEPKKVAGWVKLTDEVVQDIPRMQSIATVFLRKKHDLKRQWGILFGDGIAPNPKGAALYGRAFNAAKFADNKVMFANFLDVINAAYTDIYTTHNYEDETHYTPNLVLVNPLDFFSMIASAKTLDGTMLYPTASLFNQVIIGGMLIKSYDKVPKGKIFIGDMTKYNVTGYIPYNVTIGWVNDDFIKNQFVVLGESRLHAYVKKLDEQAFIYDDIANILAAITEEEVEEGN